MITEVKQHRPTVLDRWVTSTVRTWIQPTLTYTAQIIHVSQLTGRVSEPEQEFTKGQIWSQRSEQEPEMAEGWSQNWKVAHCAKAGLNTPDSNAEIYIFKLKACLEMDSLGLFLNSKTLNYEFIGANYNIEEPEGSVFF